jgi:hypothetical protein
MRGGHLLVIRVFEGNHVREESASDNLILLHKRHTKLTKVIQLSEENELTLYYAKDVMKNINR